MEKKDVNIALKTLYIYKECNLHLHSDYFTIYHNNNLYNKTKK